MGSFRNINFTVDKYSDFFKQLYQIGFYSIVLLEVLEERGFATADVAFDRQSVRSVGAVFGFALVDGFWVIHQVRCSETGMMKPSFDSCS